MVLFISNFHYAPNILLVFDATLPPFLGFCLSPNFTDIRIYICNTFPLRKFFFLFLTQGVTM
jgi:hypothetical protein